MEALRPSPDFTLPATGGQTITLSAMRGRWLVLYFYPKDNTPGCTTETIDFANAYEELQSLGCEVIGVSRDSLRSHENFKTKLSIPFELVSDADEVACTAYGVMKLKNMYGKQVRGIERSTFLIDAEGQIVAEWRGVKVPGHVAQVIAKVRELRAASA